MEFIVSAVGELICLLHLDNITLVANSTLLAKLLIC